MCVCAVNFCCSLVNEFVQRKSGYGMQRITVNKYQVKSLVNAENKHEY